MSLACEGITELIEGLSTHKIHATKSAQLVLSALIDYRQQFATMKEYFQAVKEEVRRIAAIMPPYAPLINTMNQVFVALERQRPLDQVLSLAAEQSRKAEREMQGITGRLLRGKHIVYTHTYSQTVSACLIHHHQTGEEFRVVLSESQPNRDGLHTREILLEAGIPCRAGLDADLQELLKRADIALFGCEAVLPSGQVIGKVGQSPAAHACAQRGIPVYIYAGTWKLLPPELAGCEALIGEICYPGMNEDMPVRLFDVTDRKDIIGIITEKGVLPPDSAGAFAYRVISEEFSHIIAEVIAGKQNDVSIHNEVR